ncbi:MAG: large-conductance mechanosensitive channel protein MscL [Eubacteriaceae bacterium]|jgi:large conductance mechanosensitive channel|nr:large-conductance mechanosensitive channel protein MscL [Eubacteriaceae bacterium]
MKKFFKEFKEFAMKGNVIDLAVAVIIGGAFGKIVTSLVADVIMPLLGLLLGKINIAELALTVSSGAGAEPVVIKYGLFLQNVIDFLIIAFCIFVAVRILNKLKRNKPEEVTEAVEEDTKDQKLLMEIRDLLKEKEKI